MATVPAETKFLGVDSSLVDLTERKGNQLDSKTEYFSIEEIKGYKVYTALLTQSGGDDPQSISSGALVEGVTYQVIGTGGGDEDFSNVGLPIFFDGAQFVATQNAEPINWGGAALGYNTGAPVVTVLENTIGNIWWSYNGVNQFEAKSNDLFTEDKTILFIQGSNDGDTSSASILNNLYHIDSDTIYCIVSSGGNLSKTSIEIRVYN